jgi:ribonuclease Z
MEKININFLGTGQAIPTEKRNHTSILLQFNNENILVDCGEGTQRQFRKAKLNPCKITRILITHWHGDHVLGIPGLLQTLELNNYNKTLRVYVPKNTKHYFELMQKLFVHPGGLKIEIKEIESGLVFQTDKFKVISEKMSHGTPCLAYSFLEKDKLKIDKKKMKKFKLKSSKLLGDIKKGKSIKVDGKTIKPKDLVYEEKGRKISFILDTEINKNAEKLAKNSDILICESTYTNQEKDLAKEYKHMTAGQAANLAKKSKSKKLVLVHLSQRYENNEKNVLQEAKKSFKNAVIAEDLMNFSI